MTYKVTLMLFICALILSCEKIFTSDELNLEKQVYSGAQLKINGYYYSPYLNNTMVNILFLYENGVVYKFATENDTNKIKENILSIIENQKKGIIGNRYFWGRFIIDSTCISYESWAQVKYLTKLLCIMV